jgi:acyl-CoA synthetase (AMP-forming)/AMP-acid ligase II
VPVVVLHPGRVVDPRTSIRYAAARMAKYATPTKIFLRAEPLPRNPAGKILKRQLRDEVLAQH